MLQAEYQNKSVIIVPVFLVIHLFLLICHHPHALTSEQKNLHILHSRYVNDSSMAML